MKPVFLAALLFVAACSAVGVPAAPQPATTDSVATTDTISAPLPLPPIEIVSFSDFVVNNLSWAYAIWMEGNNREFVGCLYGWQEGDTLRVESMEMAQIRMSTPEFALARCRFAPHFLGTAHSHPDRPNECQFSPTDKRGLNPRLPIHLIVCAPDKFVFHIKGDTALYEGTLPRALPQPDAGEKNES